MAIRITKTAFEMAEPVGKELLRKAREDQEYRKDWANKEIGQASKEVATHLAGIARGRVSVTVDPVAWERIFRGKKGAKNTK